MINFKNRLACLMVSLLLTVSVIMPTTVLAANFDLSNYFADFDDVEPGQVPMDYISLKASTLTADNFIVKADPEDSTNRYLSYDIASGNGGKYFDITSSTALTGDVVYAKRIRVNSVQIKSEFRIGSGGGSKIPILTFNWFPSKGEATAKVFYHVEGGKTGTETEFTYNKGEWYDVVILFHTPTAEKPNVATYDYFINGEMLGEGISYYEANFKGEVKSFAYQVSTNGSTNREIFEDIDDIRIMPKSAPIVRKTSPANNATDVNIVEPIKVSFNNSMNKSTLENSIILKKVSDDSVVPYTGVCDGVNFYMTPTNLLLNSEQYKVEILDGVTDIFDQGLTVSSNILTFTTGAPDSNIFIATENYFEDFEGMDEGTVPAFSAINLGSTPKSKVTVQKDPSDINNKVVSFDGLLETAATTRYFEVTPTLPLANDAIVAARIRNNTILNTTEMRIFSGVEQRLIQFNKISTGAETNKIKYMDEDGEFKDLMDYNLGEWYDVVLRLDTVNFTYSIWINGEQKLTDISYAKTGLTTGITKFQYTQTPNKSKDAVASYIDNIRLYDFTAPKVRTALPNKDATDVDILTPIKIQFNNSMANLSTSNVILTKVSDGSVINYNSSFDGVNYIIKAAPLLSANTEYKVSIIGGTSGNAAMDIFGQKLVNMDNVITFTTGDYVPRDFAVNECFTNLKGGAGNTVATLTAGKFLGYNVELTNTNSDAFNGILILALYKGDVLIEIETKDITIECGVEKVDIGFYMPSDITNCKVKAFIWNSMSDFTPLKNAKVIPEQ